MIDPELLAHILTTLAHFGRTRILQHFSTDSCILSTRIAIDVLGYYGVRARPLSVRGYLFNEAYCAAVKAGTIDEQNPSTWPEEVWAIGIGQRVSPTKLGHVVAHIQDGDGLILDMSLDQANRPAKGIELSPGVFGVDEDWLLGKKHTFYTVGTCLLMYEALPNDAKWWVTSPNWGRRDAPLRSALISEIIRKLQQEGVDK